MDSIEVNGQRRREDQSHNSLALELSVYPEIWHQDAKERCRMTLVCGRGNKYKESKKEGKRNF